MGNGAGAKQRYRAPPHESSKDAPRKVSKLSLNQAASLSTQSKKSEGSLASLTTPRKRGHIRGHKLSIVPPKRHTDRKKIRWTASLAEAYTLGEEVMPSTNWGTSVLFGSRVSDGQDCVIKRRLKGKTFRHTDDERHWRHTTEYLLNFPPNEHITQIYEVLEDHEAYYVVMEKAEGMDLFETLAGSSGLLRSDIQAILRQLLIAIETLHAKGYIHRDLKLENVMVDNTPTVTPATSRALDEQAWDPTKSVKSGGSTWATCSNTTEATCRTMGTEPLVKLIDFDTVEEFSPKSHADVVLGTDMYIPQEVYSSGHYSPATDIFSIGVIAYKLLTGRFPYPDSVYCNPGQGNNQVGSPAMKQTQTRLRNHVIDWSLPPFNEDKDALELCRSMMDPQDSNRPSAAQALEHPWFSSFFMKDPSELTVS